MFTGIVQSRGRILAAERNSFGMRLVIDAGAWTHRPLHGESVSVNGCCLTVTDSSGGLSFDVIAQTLANTTLGDLQPGDDVNLESCVTPATLLSGHIVQGHVDGVGRVMKIHRGADEVRMTIAPPADLLDAMVPRGSIAVDGVSLTLASVHPDAFEVALIPTTLELTTLGSLEEGARVNLETDMIVKTLVHLWRRASGGDAGKTPGERAGGLRPSGRS